MKTMLIFIVLCSFSFKMESLNAKWDPNGLSIKEGITYQRLLRNKKFINLKKNILNEVTDSWCSPEKATLLLELVTLIKPKVSVEIGVFTGSSLLPIAAALKFTGSGIVYGIDAWSNCIAIQHLTKKDPNLLWWSCLDMNQIRQKAKHMIEKFDLDSWCTLIQLPSKDAVSFFDAIDFLHLDGDFSLEGSREDVLLYLPKVNPGGYILISNAYFAINGTLSKMPTIYELLKECTLICEENDNNTLLFQKN